MVGARSTEGQHCGGGRWRVSETEILDQIVRAGPLTAAEVDAATRRFKKALIERAPRPELRTNHRNGTSGKTVLTDDGPVPIEVPRDREARLPRS